SSRALWHLPSFPTRRSSDLVAIERTRTGGRVAVAGCVHIERTSTAGRIVAARCVVTERKKTDGCVVDSHARCQVREGIKTLSGRSEEHTSELQSRFDLVCRL